MKKVIALISAVVVLSVPMQSFAQERTTILKELLGSHETTSTITTEKERFDIGIGAWPTTGRLDSFVYQPVGSEWIEGGALRAKPGDTISKLQNKLDSNMVIMDVNMYLFYFFYADASMSLGHYSGGQQKDYDWQPQYRPDLTSLSDSSAKGYSMMWDANVDLRCVDWNASKSFIDLSLGYLYYCDNIQHLNDTTLDIWNYQTINTPLEDHDSRDKYTFDGFRIGGRVRIQLFDRVAFKGRAGVLPWMNVTDKAYWNLRGTTFVSTAYGTSYDLMGGFEFKITKDLLVEAGYKYMYFRSYRGIERTGGLDGESGDLDGAFSANAERGGFYFMGRLRM